MGKIHKLALSAAICLVYGTNSLAANSEDYHRACTLYNNAMYVQAMDLFQSLPEYKSDPVVDGYVALCSVKLQVPGYENRALEYLSDYHTSTLAPAVHGLLAYDYFDRAQYSDALKHMDAMDVAHMPAHLKAEYNFKRGFALYQTGNQSKASECFTTACSLPSNDYTAPSQYMLGFCEYSAGNFETAAGWFEKSSVDERFSTISNFYLTCIHYELQDYNYVLEKGVPMMETLPEDRKDYLSRLISESYLVKGNKKEARKYYELSAPEEVEKTRGDYFYAGSLMFTTGDWKGAVENYSKMENKTDSLGQVAWYQTALSQIKLKNKVAALDAFKNASALSFDSKMAEDAHFNYAKLAFDLNGDTSVFSDYMSKYSDKVRGEMIYSYMALAALSDKNYQTAIDNYDKIESLSDKDQQNYIKANYLRGAELLDAGSYRSAVQCFQAVSYYVPKSDPMSQLAHYSLGEAYYRNRQWSEAATEFTSLYNKSAFDGQPMADTLPYNIAWSYFKKGDYPQAQKWFQVTVNQGNTPYRKDALTRKADCIYAMKDYSEAISAYQTVLDQYYDVNDIYPYYQCALCCGLAKNGRRAKDANKLIQQEISLLSPVKNADPSSAYYPEALFELGKVQQSQKMTAEAVKTFDLLSRTTSDSTYIARAILEMGTVKRSAKDVNGALECYKKVVEKLPNSGYAEDALLAIESIYQSQNMPQLYFSYLASIGRYSVKSERDKEDMVFNAAEQIYYTNNIANALEAFKNFKESYPKSKKISQADFYMAECYRMSGDKQMACDYYELSMKSNNETFRDNSMIQYANLQYSMENYKPAYEMYSKLLKITKLPLYRYDALVGTVRSAYRCREFEVAAKTADQLCKDTFATPGQIREASMIKARSLMCLSRREEAIQVLETLAQNPNTEEGAEAAYLVVQSLYDNARFDDVIVAVQDLGKKGCSIPYYSAKSFLILGDVYAEQGKYKQAKATFQSIANNYRGKDEILSEVNMRLESLEKIQNQNQ